MKKAVTINIIFLITGLIIGAILFSPHGHVIVVPPPPNAPFGPNEIPPPSDNVSGGFREMSPNGTLEYPILK